VPDLSVSGDSFDLVGDDPHDPTTTSETRSANAIAEPNSRWLPTLPAQDQPDHEDQFLCAIEERTRI
jgi:hypothetical protein